MSGHSSKPNSSFVGQIKFHFTTVLRNDIFLQFFWGLIPILTELKPTKIGDHRLYQNK